MSRAVGAGLVLAVLAGLVWVFLSDFGRLTPKEEYGLVLDSLPYSARVNRLAIIDSQTDSPDVFERDHSATAVFVVEGANPRDELTITVFETDSLAAAADNRARKKYAERERVQEINTFPSEFCVKLPRLRFACIDHYENAFFRGEVVASRTDWEFPVGKADLDALLHLRVLRKMWSAIKQRGTSLAR